MRAMSAVPCLFLASALGAGAADLPRIDANARVAAMVTNAVMRKDSTALAAYLSGRDSTWEWRTEFWGKHTLAAMTGDAAFRANVAASEGNRRHGAVRVRRWKAVHDMASACPRRLGISIAILADLKCKGERQ